MANAPTIIGTTKGGVPIFIGSRWKENDPRINRVVEVRSYLRRKAGIQTVQPDGSLAPRLTWAALERFGGSARGRYSLVSHPAGVFGVSDVSK